MYTVYTTSTCPYCVYAKELLEEQGLEYREINVNDKPEYREFLLFRDLKTVPQIYYGMVHIGGYTQLKEYLNAP